MINAKPKHMSKDTVERFSDRVENYVKYRPSYPDEMIDRFRRLMNLDQKMVIADIGSGTGISAKPFLENGNRVFGIEPNELMRKASEEYLRDFSNFECIDGTSENTNLAEKSIDIIVAAQAFHWFEKEKTRIEFERILKTGGFLALIWNERILDENEFLADYEAILLEFGTDYREVRHENVTQRDFEGIFGRKFELSTLKNSQTLDFDGMKGRILSSSYMPSEDDQRFPALLKKLKALFAEHQKNGRIQVLYNTNIFYTQF